MKKFYFLFIWLFSLNSFAQDSNLLGEWFLHTITENGNSPIVTTPDIYTLNFNINNTNNNIYDNSGGLKCNGYNATTTFLSETTISIQFVGVTLQDCSPSEEGLYLNILTGFASMIHTYVITGTSNNSTLTLTNSNNDVLLFGRQALSIYGNSSNNLLIALVENPIQDVINLLISKQISANLYYAIYSIDGKIIRNYSLLNNDKIDVEYLNSGMYFLSIKTKENQHKMIKLMKR